MFTTIILFLIVCAAFALVWWGVQQFALPPMMRVLILVIIGLLALGFLYNFVAGGHVGFSMGPPLR